MLVSAIVAIAKNRVIGKDNQIPWYLSADLVYFKKTETLQVNWKTALELTKYLRTLDPDDPVKYDFALFGLGVMEKF